MRALQKFGFVCLTLGPLIWAAATAPVLADDAGNVALGVTRAAAVSMLCFDRTGGSVGVPSGQAFAYYTGASAAYTKQFHRSMQEIANLDETARNIQGNPGILATATKDKWPPVCDQQTAALLAASKGDFSAWMAK